MAFERGASLQDLDSDVGTYSGGRALVRDTLNVLYHDYDVAFPDLVDAYMDYFRNQDTPGEYTETTVAPIAAQELVVWHTREMIKKAKEMGPAEQREFGVLIAEGERFVQRAAELDEKDVIDLSDEGHNLTDASPGYQNRIRPVGDEDLYCSKTWWANQVANMFLDRGGFRTLVGLMDEDFQLRVLQDELVNMGESGVNKRDALFELRTGTEAFPPFLEGLRFIGPVESFDYATLRDAQENILYHYSRLGEQPL